MADKEIFSLDMDNLEQFPVDLNSNDNNFNVNLNNEDQNFDLDSTQEDEDFTVDFGEVINLGTTDYEKLQHLPQINGVTLIGNKTTEDLGISTDSSYDASWLFAVSTATQEQYNGLLDAVENGNRIYLTSAQETFNALAYVNEENSLTIIVNVGGVDTYDDVIYADNIVAYFIVDKDTLAVSAEIGETNGASLARAIGNLTTNLTNEITNRYNADVGLQNQIDAITVSSDVVDVVGTYAELQQYDTSHLKDNDIIKVLQDSTHSNAMSYYRWVISGGTGSFQYVGSEGPFYTKSESDTLLGAKQNTIDSSHKLASDLVDDTNQTNKFVTSAEKTTWNNKADYGFYGIISGTSANPTDGVSLTTGVYKADESKATSYISLPMDDGTTKKQGVQKGGIVIRTTSRLIVMATQQIMYQYDTVNQYFYEGVPIVESVLLREPADGMMEIGTASPPNTYYVTEPIYYLDATINTGQTGHTRITFTVDSTVEEGDFELYLYDSEGNDLIYEDGAFPVPKAGETWILEFYGNTCEALCFKATDGKSKEDLLKQFMRRNSNQIYYPDVDGKPNFSIQTAAGNAEDNRNVNITNSDVYLSSFHNLQYYGINGTMIPLDLSLYNVSASQQANQLQPNTQLPDGVYYVTNQGRLHIGTADIGSYLAKPGEMIFKDGTELIILGYYAACYFTWNNTDQAYEGGYFTTTLDVESMLEDYDKGMTVSKSSTATGTIAMNDHRWTRKTRAAGINSANINFPNEETIDDGYKSRLTCKTSSSFTSFTITSRNYGIRFEGDDCSNGTITATTGKYYDMHAEADGFGGVLVHVTSYTLPS